jgi:asparagine synthase (glutamine-hydrolysing)
MCGIAGVIERDGARPVEAGDLRAMAGALVHRGPDDEGILLEGSVGFAMRRLAVIDLASGRQPIWNEDKTAGVVQNGEIYNFADLRTDLQRRGHTFSTASDTEAIVHLYEETGPSADLPARLDGMFALALYDRRRQVVVLARDRAGKKPLYLYRDDRRLLFASELAALFAAAAPADRPLDRSLDPAAIDAYLALQYVPGPATIFRRVRQLPPGSILVLDRAPGGWIERPERRYWALPGRPAGEGAGWRRFSQAVDGCEALLRDAVRRRLVADVPLGAFLSGGLDSSLVAALMAREAGSRISTFTIGFDEPDLDESQAAAGVARHLGADHHPLEMPSTGAEDLLAILRRCDQPLGDPAIVPTFHLSRLTRRHVTVALSGEGADEVFGGYHWYRRPLAGRLLGGRLPPRRAAVPAPPAAGPPDGPAARATGALYRRREQASAEERRALLAAPLREACAGEAARASYAAAALHRDGPAGIAALQAIDFTTWMADDLLVKVDRMSKAHALEVRCPYLDHRLVEAVLPGPDRFKIRWGRRKALLRAVARRHLPEAAVGRKKHGFQVPVDRLLRTTLAAALRDLTERERLKRQGIFDPDGVAGLLRRWQGDASRARAVWKVLCFQAWWEGAPR